MIDSGKKNIHLSGRNHELPFNRIGIPHIGPFIFTEKLFKRHLYHLMTIAVANPLYAGVTVQRSQYP